MFSNQINQKEVEIDEDIYNLEIKPKDVIFGEDVKDEALKIFMSGYESAMSTYIRELDPHFKFKRVKLLFVRDRKLRQIYLLKYLLLLQVLYDGKSLLSFSPEDNPAAEFYHDLVEICLAQNCTPDSFKQTNFINL